MPWIAALISAAAGGLTAAQQKKAAKKGTAGAGINLEAAYGAAKKEYGPYSDVGRNALSRLAALQGVEGYRTPSDIALREHLAAKPTLASVAGAGKVRGSWTEQAIANHPARDLLGDEGASIVAGMGVPGSQILTPITQGIFARSKKNRKALGARQAVNEAAAAARQAEAQVKYEADLRAWNAKTEELTKQRDIELQTYDPTALLRQTPGYQFRYQTGLGAVGSRQAARSSMLGGGALKELTKYGQDFATGEYGAEVGRLSNLAGIGERSAGALSNISIGQGTGQAGLALNNAAAEAGYYGDLNKVTQSTLGNYLAYRNRQQNQRQPTTQSPYATSYGGNTYTSPETANQFSGQDDFMNS